MTPARRWTLHGPHDLRLERLELAAPEAHQVLVETRFSALSVASELSVYLGRVSVAKWPHKLGYQSVGRVRKVGQGVTDLSPGQRVVGTWGHASHALMRAGPLIPVPDSVSDRVALAVILGEETMKGVRKLGLPPGAEVLVAGAGLLGLLSVFNLTRIGHRVCVYEPVAERRELARLLGAAEVWMPGQSDPELFGSRLFGSGLFRYALECSASPEGFRDLLEQMQPGGKVVVLSDGNWGALALSPTFHRRELTVVASSDGEDYPAYARWLWQHADPLLERLFPVSVSAADLSGLLPMLDGDANRPPSALLEWTSDLTQS